MPSNFTAAASSLLLTLIIPTLTLPPLLRFLKLNDGNERQSDEVRARIAMARTAAKRITQLQENGTYDATLLADFNRRYQGQLKRLTPNLEVNAYSALDPSDQQRRALLLELIELERGTLHELRSRGELHDDVYHHLADELDLEALRIRRNMRPI